MERAGVTFLKKLSQETDCCKDKLQKCYDLLMFCDILHHPFFMLILISNEENVEFVCIHNYLQLHITGREMEGGIGEKKAMGEGRKRIKNRMEGDK